MHLCFFCKTSDRSIFERVGFYADDIRILKELGHKVTIATSWSEIPSNTDLIYAWWWTWAVIPLLKQKLQGIPVVICGVFDYETPPRGRSKCYLDRPWWEKGLLRLSLRMANANIFISQFELDQITTLFKVQAPRLIPCSVDVQTYRPAENDKRERFLFNVAWSGGFNLERKCLKEIVEGFAVAARQIPDLTLIMAGKQGEYHNLLVEAAEKGGVADRVKFLGAISQAEKIDLMQRCMAYVQPTLFEGFGLAIAEAMACGAPVITSPAGAVQEVVGDAGLLLKNESPDEIGGAIVKIASQPELRETFSQKGAARMREKFTYQRRKNSLAAILSEVMN